MKKINKKLSLGLAICLLASPIATNLDTAYAQEIEESVDTLSFEDFKKEYEDFKKTQAYEILEDEKKEKLDQAFSSINEENFSQENYDDFHSLLNDIEKSYLSLIYDPLYKELGELNKENLSDELKEEIESYKPSFETIEEYDLAIEDIPKSKEKIEAYNKELQDKKDLLKKGLDQVKDTDIDLEDEKKVLENEASKVKEVDQAIESLNKKIEDYNKRISEKLKLDRKKSLW